MDTMKMEGRAMSLKAPDVHSTGRTSMAGMVSPEGAPVVPASRTQSCLVFVFNPERSHVLLVDETPTTDAQHRMGPFGGIELTPHRGDVPAAAIHTRIGQWTDRDDIDDLQQYCWMGNAECGVTVWSAMLRDGFGSLFVTNGEGLFGDRLLRAVAISAVYVVPTVPNTRWLVTLALDEDPTRDYVMALRSEVPA